MLSFKNTSVGKGEIERKFEKRRELNITITRDRGTSFREFLLSTPFDCTSHSVIHITLLVCTQQYKYPIQISHVTHSMKEKKSHEFSEISVKCTIQAL